MSEYVSFIEDFPGIAVEVCPDKFDKGLPVLLIEARNVRPDNYEVSNLARYSKVYSWNRRFLSILPKSIPSELIQGFPLFDNYSWLDEFRPVSERINGVCLIAKKWKREIEGDLSEAREVVFQHIHGVEKHAYGRVPFCGEFYRGAIGATAKEIYPSSMAKLKKLNEYKFNLCFENCYHELWSYDYITEKIFDSFRAKTVPIYLGCFNIEEHIPPELFIDFRKFRSVAELSEYLREFPDELFTEMTERAYTWVKQSTWGDLARLRRQLAKYSSACLSNPEHRIGHSSEVY